jgi:predicted nucleotidyltransferase
MALDDSLLAEIVRRILTVSRPDRIILFGSAAAGSMNPDSDIDVMVLRRDLDNARKESVRIGDSLRGLGFPFDVVVMPTDRFEQTRNLAGGIAFPADKDGKVIYDAG